MEKEDQEKENRKEKILDTKQYILYSLILYNQDQIKKKQQQENKNE